MKSRYSHLLCLEEEDGAVAEVEVDEMFRLVGDEGAEVTSNNAVPSWSLALIESFLDVLSDVLLNCKFGHSLLCNVNSLLLHVIRHVCAFDLSLKLVLQVHTLFGSHDFGAVAIV